MQLKRKLVSVSALCCGLLIAGCHKDGQIRPDHPYVAHGAVMKDVIFHSAALNRDMPYRVFLPDHLENGATAPVIYLLHGANGTFRDWSDDSLVSNYAARGFILVMPEGEFSYYLNAAEDPAARFEDYTFGDLIADVETRFPAAKTRDKRAIIGISMGGFAAIKIAVTRPELFCFVAALSPPIDITHRQFRIRRWGEWWRTRRIFGPSGSEARRARDPISLLQTVDVSRMPYLYITVGQNEPLLRPDRAFSERMTALHFKHEFHTKPGGHDWNEWNSQLNECFGSLMQHVQQ
jgi:putative tributyrin esterase